MNEDDLLIPYNSLLVVGNGFDIGLHLPTKYTDFMRHFLMYRCNLKKLPMPTIKNDDKLHTLFANKMNRWRNKYKNENTEKIDEELFVNTLFKNKLILILIFKYNPNELFRLTGTLKTRIRNSYGEVTLYPNGINENYFLKNEIKGSEINWFNLEEILLEISNNERYQKIIDTIKNKSGNSNILSQNGININDKRYDELKKGLIFLKSSLSIYLHCVQDIYLKKPSKQTKKYFQEICKTLEFKMDKDVNKYSKIISLNYTNSAQKLFSGISTKYPHGVINDENPENSNIVLGFYNSTAENNFDTSFIDFQKYYQRILLGTGNYETLDSKILYIDFYGFSCDPADTELINVLLENHKEVRRIRIFCYKEKEQNIINLIKCIGRTLVLDLTNQKKLEFKLIPETK